MRYKRRGSYFDCKTCGTEFYVPPSRVKQAIKNGSQIRYCSIKCYDKSGANNPMHGRKHTAAVLRKMKITHKGFKPGRKNPNYGRFHPSFFTGRSGTWWKRFLLKELGKCERCNYNEELGILEIHHKDRNRRNNSRENLLLLCPNCHSLIHFQESTGKHKHNGRKGIPSWFSR